MVVWGKGKVSKPRLLLSGQEGLQRWDWGCHSPIHPRLVLRPHREAHAWPGSQRKHILVLSLPCTHLWFTWFPRWQDDMIRPNLSSCPLALGHTCSAPILCSPVGRWSVVCLNWGVILLPQGQEKFSVSVQLWCCYTEFISACVRAKYRS